MMMFGRVAESLSTKYGYVGTHAALAISSLLLLFRMLSSSVRAGCESSSFLSTFLFPFHLAHGASEPLISVNLI